MASELTGTRIVVSAHRRAEIVVREQYAALIHVAGRNAGRQVDHTGPCHGIAIKPALRMIDLTTSIALGVEEHPNLGNLRLRYEPFYRGRESLLESDPV